MNKIELKLITEPIHANYNLKIRKNAYAFQFLCYMKPWKQHDEYNFYIIYRGRLAVPNF